MCLGCLSPSVILSLEDFQLPNALSTPSYELRLLTTMEKHINTGIKILSLSMRLDTVTHISSGLSCMEDHGARGRPWNLPMVVAKLFLWHALSGHEAHLACHDDTQHQCGQRMGAWRATEMPALGTCSKSQALLLSQGKCCFHSAEMMSRSLKSCLPRFAFLKYQGWAYFLTNSAITPTTGNADAASQPKHFVNKEWSFLMHYL